MQRSSYEEGRRKDREYFYIRYNVSLRLSTPIFHAPSFFPPKILANTRNRFLGWRNLRDSPR